MWLEPVEKRIKGIQWNFHAQFQDQLTFHTGGGVEGDVLGLQGVLVGEVTGAGLWF